MLKYITLFGKGASATEDKTILEELLEHPHGQRKMDKAYHLLSLGFAEEAGVLFDEILSEEPFNRDALTGKQLIARQARVEQRMDNAGERVHRAKLASPEAEPEPEAEPKPKRKNPLRSKKVLTALVVAFVMFCGLAAAFLGTGGFDGETAENPPEYSQQQ